MTKENKLINTHSSSSKRGTLQASEEVNPPGGTRFPSIIMERPRYAIKNLENLKASPDLIRFYIKQKFGADIPVNAKLESYQQGDNQHHKIEKYLKGKSKEDEDGIYLAHLYDDFLNEIEGVKFTDNPYGKKKVQRSAVRDRISEKLETIKRAKPVS